MTARRNLKVAKEIDRLRGWASGEFYPLSPEELGRNALDDLYDEMKLQSKAWWAAFRVLLAEADRTAAQNLVMPFAALLDAGGEYLRDDVAAAARTNPKLRNAFWNAMDFAMLSGEAYRRFGRQMTVEAFARHQARIPVAPGQPWPDEGDEWSGDAVIYLVLNDPDEAWTVVLDLLAMSVDASTIGAFIIEDLLGKHGDDFIERIEAEAARNERLRQALPTARYLVPDHLLSRVKAAAGLYWKD
jgi:uncharacterized protein DUF6869